MMDRIGNVLAENAALVLFGCTLVAAGAFLLLAYWLTRPEGGRTGEHRGKAQQEQAASGAHRLEGTPGEKTRVLRYDTAVARARVMNDVTGETATIKREAPRLKVREMHGPDGWFFDLVSDRIVLFKDGRPERIVNVSDYATKRGSVTKDLFVNGLPMIPDVIPYIEQRRTA